MRCPDVRQAGQALIQKFYLTNAARAAFYPNLSLSGSLGWTNGSGAMVVNPAEDAPAEAPKKKKDKKS